MLAYVKTYNAQIRKIENPFHMARWFSTVLQYTGSL